MTDRFRIAAAQLNPTVGALADNVAKAVEAWEQAKAEKADLLVLPEMFIGGYQLLDLVKKPAFHRACVAAVEELAAQTADGGPQVLVGSPLFEDGELFNAVFLLENGGIKTVFRWPDLSQWCADRRSDLRGRLVFRRFGDFRRIRGRDSHRPERVAIRAG